METSGLSEYLFPLHHADPSSSLDNDNDESNTEPPPSSPPPRPYRSATAKSFEDYDEGNEAHVNYYFGDETDDALLGTASLERTDTIRPSEERHVPPTEEDMEKSSFVVPRNKFGEERALNYDHFDRYFSRQNFGGVVLPTNGGGLIHCQNCNEVQYQTAFVNPKQPPLPPNKVPLPATVRPFKPKEKPAGENPDDFVHPRNAPRWKGKQPIRHISADQVVENVDITSPLPPKPLSAIPLKSIIGQPNTPEEHLQAWAQKVAAARNSATGGSSGPSRLNSTSSAGSDYQNFGLTDLVHRGYINPSKLPNLSQFLPEDRSLRARPSQPRPTKADPICDKCQTEIARRVVKLNPDQQRNLDERCGLHVTNKDEIWVLPPLSNPTQYPVPHHLQKKKGGILRKFVRRKPADTEEKPVTRFRTGSSGASSSIGTKVGAWVKKTKAELKSLGHSGESSSFYRHEAFEDGGSVSQYDSKSSCASRYRYGVTGGSEALASLRYEAGKAHASHTTIQTDTSSNQFATLGSSVTMDSNEGERTTGNFADQLAQKAGKFYGRTSGNKSRKNLSDSERQRQILDSFQSQQEALPRPSHPQCWSCGGVIWGVLPHLRENPAVAQLCGGCSPFVTHSEEEILRPEVDEEGNEETYQQMENRLSRLGFFPVDEPEDEGSYSNIYEDVIVEEDEDEDHEHQDDDYNDDRSRTMVGDYDETVIAGLDKTITIASAPRSN